MPPVHRSQGYRGKRLPHSKDLRALRLLKRKAKKVVGHKGKKKGAKGSGIRGVR